MADDDTDGGFADEGGGTSEKKSRGGGFLPKILLFVAIGLGAIIVIVAGVMITRNIMGANKPQRAAIPISEDYKGIAEE